MGRDRGKGRSRGGPRIQISSIEDLQLRDAIESEYKAAREARRGKTSGRDGAEDDDDEDDEEDDDDQNEVTRDPKVNFKKYGAHEL